MFVFQHESVAPYPSSPVQEVSSEQGFNLAIFFVCYLNQEMDFFSKTGPKDLYDFSFGIQASRYGCTKDWNQAVCQVTNISNERQKTSNIQVKDLLSCLIEFTKISNKEHNFQLGPFIALLEEMQVDPSLHPKESEIWDWVIKNSHKRLVFPYAEFSIEKEVSVEQGFHITMLFFEDLGPILSSAFDFSKDGEMDRWLTYDRILSYGREYPAEWNEAVFRVTKIPKGQQKEIQIPIEVVFPSIIEFTKIFHKRWECQLSYLLNLLEAIQKDPGGFPIESRLWKQVVKDSYSARGLWIDFDWNSELPSDEQY